VGIRPIQADLLNGEKQTFENQVLPPEELDARELERAWQREKALVESTPTAILGKKAVNFEHLLFKFINAINYSTEPTFNLKEFRADCRTITTLATRQVFKFPKCKRIEWTQGLFNEVFLLFDSLGRFLNNYKSRDGLISRGVLFGNYPTIGGFLARLESHKKENISRKLTDKFSTAVLDFVAHIRSLLSTEEDTGNCSFSIDPLKTHCLKIINCLMEREILCKFVCQKIDWDSELLDLVDGFCDDLFNFLDNYENENSVDTCTIQELDDFGLEEFCKTIELHKKSTPILLRG